VAATNGLDPARRINFVGFCQSVDVLHECVEEVVRSRGGDILAQERALKRWAAGGWRQGAGGRVLVVLAGEAGWLCSVDGGAGRSPLGQRCWAEAGPVRLGWCWCWAADQLRLLLPVGQQAGSQRQPAARLLGPQPAMPGSPLAPPRWPRAL
jgi:hypothetical protein